MNQNANEARSWGLHGFVKYLLGHPVSLRVCEIASMARLAYPLVVGSTQKSAEKWRMVDQIGGERLP